MKSKLNSGERHYIEDVASAIREGRPLRPADAYRIVVSDKELHDKNVELADPVPTGRQILQAIGIQRSDDFSLFAILQSGDFEDIRLDETVDLRERGAERFIYFKTDRVFKFTLTGQQIAWGEPAVNGSILYALARLSPNEALFLEVPGGTDRLVTEDDSIDLRNPGIERFIAGPNSPSTFEIIVNARPETVNDKRVTYEQVVKLAFPGRHGPNTVFSVTYRHADSKPHAGELGAGGSVEVKQKGTIFNVTKTDKS
jgi:hypothetical protein